MAMKLNSCSVYDPTNFDYVSNVSHTAIYCFILPLYSYIVGFNVTDLVYSTLTLLTDLAYCRIYFKKYLAVFITEKIINI